MSVIASCDIWKPARMTLLTLMTLIHARSLRACLKLSRLKQALEAHAGHEQRGENGHVPRAGGARLVVDAQAAVALQATERLLDLPAPRLDHEAPPAGGADELLDDAVAGEELAAALRGEAEGHPGEMQRGMG